MKFVHSALVLTKKMNVYGVLRLRSRGNLHKILPWYSLRMLVIFISRMLLQSIQSFLTWFDVLDMGVPAPEEMAGCEYIMSDLIGGKT